ncbi:MAG: SDR family oxidoreductase [Pseudomonadota bacterium]
MHLLCFGVGYSALRVCDAAIADGWRVTGTSTSDAGVARLNQRGIAGLRFDGTTANDDIAAALASATHVVVSIPPSHDQWVDPVIEMYGDQIASGADQLSWIGYLSTIGVYGDHAGAWIDETTEPKPVSSRSRARLAVERQWTVLADQRSIRLQIFRLAGIYGPGRSAIDRLRAGTARRIVKPGQVFNRIHVDDIATAVGRGMRGGGSKQVYNVCDDLPTPPQDVIAYAAELIGVDPPPEIDFNTADLSPMARSFYGENKRVRNDRLKQDLDVRLAYPSYREGLTALAKS